MVIITAQQNGNDSLLDILASLPTLPPLGATGKWRRDLCAPSILGRLAPHMMLEKIGAHFVLEGICTYELKRPPAAMKPTKAFLYAPRNGAPVDTSYVRQSECPRMLALLEWQRTAKYAKPSGLASVHAEFEKWLILPDGPHRYDQVDITLAVVVARRMNTDPWWQFIVAPPGFGKSEVGNTLVKVPDVYELSSLTPRTLISGWDADKRIKIGDAIITEEGVKEDASLLPKLNGKTVFMKDFTSVLSKRRDDQKEILAQLREIYDGRYTSGFGTGKEFKWEGKIGLLACVTTVIDREYAMMAQLGERFLMYRLPEVDRRASARRATKQRTQESRHHGKLEDAVAAYLAKLMKPEVLAIPEEMEDGIFALADYVARARTAPSFDSEGDFAFFPKPESPTRLAKQLSIAASALAVVRQEAVISHATFTTVKRIAYDTVPELQQQLIQLMLQSPNGVNADQAARVTYYHPKTMARRFRALVAAGLANESSGPSNTYRWKPSKTLLELMRDIDAVTAYDGAGVTAPALR